MKVLLLGSGNSVPGARSAPGLFVRGDSGGWLIDPGPGATHRLGAAGVSPTEVHEILITHTHPDHVCDLVPFLFCLRNPRYGDPAPPRIVGPPGFAAFYELLRAPFAKWLPPAGEGIEVVEYTGGVWESGGSCLCGEMVQHIPSSLAWRIADNRGTTFAYSGDTERCPGVVRAASEVDLLLLECTTPSEEVPGHLSSASASEVIRASGARRVVLVHLGPECDEVDLIERIDGDVRDRVELGRDGVWYSAGTNEP
ncbi:MAG: MBL fold metallo-hydrolase [Planctomycetota bacterium]|jgi:ribonuclease BN (tRNA processing enzyme)